MPGPASIILATAMALGTTEALAYWWTHPSPTGVGEPILCYRPHLSRSAGVPPASGSSSSNADPSSTASSPESPTAVTDRRHNSTAHLPPPTANSSSSTTHRPPPTANSSTYTPLPELAARTIPKLHCTTGNTARIDLADGVTIHIAFFEWDRAVSGNVLEAFKHLPEQCLGSIGMTLIEHRPSRSYQVGSESLSFDHTVFRDPADVIVHAFKGAWVSGASNLLDRGLRSEAGQLRQLRWKASLNRFHPTYARVAQGAVRGIPNPDAAWQAFQDAMLADLTMER